MTSSAGSSSLKRRLGNLARKTSNRTCCDCPEKSPTWAVLIEPPSLMKGSTLVAFLCFSCAECHKGLLASEESPEFSARVKHLTLDKWTEEEVDNAERSGNKKVNFIYEALLKEQEEKCGSRLKPIPGSHGASRVRYIREKYVNREFYSTAAHYKCIQHDTEGTPWSPTTPLGSRRSLNFFMASSSKGVNDAAGGEVSVFSGNSSSKQSAGTKSTSASTTKENSSSSRRKFSLASLTSPIRSRLSPVKKAKPPPVTSATLPLKSDSDEAPSHKGLAHMLEQNKKEVSERTRSERSTASEPVKSGKDNYRDPRRAEFMNSRSSLDFTMDDLDLPRTNTTNTTSLKKGPGTIKIPVAAIASTASATPKSTSARVNMYSKTKSKDRRSRSSSRNRATSKTTETQKPRTRSSSRHNLERDGRGRSRGASQTHRHTRTSKSPPKGLHSRTSSPTKRSSSQQRDHRTPSPPKRSTRVSKSPRRGGRVSKSPRRGERGISRSNSELDITSSPKSRRSLVRAQIHASFNKLSSDQNLTKRTSLVRSRSGRGGMRDRSASRTRRPTSPDKPSIARSRSSSALRKDASDSGRSFRKSDQAALREAANRQNARRERSRSRSSRALTDVQSSKDDSDTPKFKIEVPKPGEEDYAELEKSLSVMPSTADDSSSAEDVGYTEPLKASHHSTSDLQLSDKALFSERDNGHKSLSTFVPSTKTTNNPSLSAKLRKEKSNVSKFHNSFGGTSKTATVTSSGSGSSKESNAMSLSLESAVGLKYQNNDDDIKEGEESFEVISTAVGHRSLQSLKKGSSFNRKVPSRKNSSTQPKRSHSYVHPTTYLDDLGDESEDGMVTERKIIHGGGDKFQNSKSRMSKTKAAKKDAERASRKSSIFAALDMDDDDWKSPPPSTSKGPLGLRRMAPVRSKSGDALLIKPSASAVRMGETERNQAPRRRVPPRSKSEAGSSLLLRQYQQSLNDIPNGDNDHHIDGVGKFHSSVGGLQPQQAPRVVAKLNVPNIHKSEAFPRKRPPTRSKSDIGRATTMLHPSKRLSGTSTTSIPEDDFSDSDDHDDKEKTTTTNGRTSSVRLTDFDRSFDALDFPG